MVCKLQVDTYRANVAFVELWPDDCNLHKILDVCHAWKPAKRRGEGLLDMAICIAGHFDLEAGKVEVGEHAVVGTACIVEGELVECQRNGSGKQQTEQMDLELEWVLI